MAGRKKPKHNLLPSFFLVVVLSAFIVMAIYFNSGSNVTGFFVGGTPAFSADFEQAKPDNSNMPVGFYLKEKHNLFYEPDQDDNDAGYVVADRSNNGLHGNAMLIDASKLVNPGEKLDRWIESATIPVEPSRSYTLSLSEKYAKSGGDGDFATIQLVQFDSDFLGLDSDDMLTFSDAEIRSSHPESLTVQKNGQWSTIAVGFTTLSNTKYVRFKISSYALNNVGRDKFFIDDFTLS
jgi:hypothetical protein